MRKSEVTADGQITSTSFNLKLSSPRAKNIPLGRLLASAISLAPVRPARGAYRDRHGRRCRNAVDAAASGARGDTGRLLFESCERSTGARTNRAASVFTNASPDRYQTRRSRSAKAAADGKTVWSWHPLLVSSRRRFGRPDRARQDLQSADDGDKTNSSPGRARHKPLKPAACGNAGCFRWTRGDYRVHFSCTRAAGASGARHSPRPPRARD